MTAHVAHLIVEIVSTVILKPVAACISNTLKSIDSHNRDTGVGILGVEVKSRNTQVCASGSQPVLIPEVQIVRDDLVHAKVKIVHDVRSQNVRITKCIVAAVGGTERRV